MIKRLMQPVDVIARFDREGKVTPLRFSWRSSEYLIESVGRHWETSDGHHYLVMVPGGRIFELVFSPLQERWFLGSAQPDQSAA